jgi:tetratricopeptide (TPR) repeat protein
MRAVSKLSFVALLVLSHAVAAQEPAPSGEPAPVAESEPAPPDESEARALFHAGQSAYESGRFEKALEYFLQAHELSGRPALLYNVGQAADRARRDETALNAFRMYLQQVPDAPNAEMVQNRIASLEIAVDNARARSLVEPTPPARTTAPTMAVQPVSTDPAQRPLDAAPLHEQWWFWGGIGAAVVVTVVVIALASSGGSDGVARPPAGSDGVVVLTLGGP